MLTLSRSFAPLSGVIASTVKFTDRLRQLGIESGSNAVKALRHLVARHGAASIGQPDLRHAWPIRKVDLTALVRDDEALAEHIRQNVAGVFHVAGTCRMGAAI